jgi:hypothetical protein
LRIPGEGFPPLKELLTLRVSNAHLTEKLSKNLKYKINTLTLAKA